MHGQVQKSDRIRELAAFPLASKRSLDQVREHIQFLHYSLQTEKAPVYRAHFFLRGPVSMAACGIPESPGAGYGSAVD